METRAAELAGEMGPIANYASSKAVCGRAGLFPSRYQSDEVDRGGKLTRFRNARLRAAWMMVADNMCKCNVYWMTKAAKWRESWLAPIPLEVPRQKVREKPTSRRAGNTILCGCFYLLVDTTDFCRTCRDSIDLEPFRPARVSSSREPPNRNQPAWSIFKVRSHASVRVDKSRIGHLLVILGF